MKCPRCKSEKITIINQPIQTDEKFESLTITLLSFFAILILITGIILFFTANSQYNGDDLKSATEYILSGYFIKYSVLTLIFIGLINAIRPRKMSNKLICVCLECGYSAELRQPTSPQKENPPTQNPNNK